MQRPRDRPELRRFPVIFIRVIIALLLCINKLAILLASWSRVIRLADGWSGLAVAEVADSGEDHGDAELVGGCDDFGVADGAAGLDDGGGAGLGDGFEAVGEWEEGVGGGDAAGEGRTAFMAPKRAASTRDIWPAPMPTVWP